MKVKKTSLKDNYLVLDDNNKEIKPITEYLDFLMVKNYSPNTIKNYAYDLKRFFVYLVKIDKTYDKADIRDLVNFLAFLKPTLIKGKKLSSNTVKRILAGVTSFYDWIEISEYLINGINPYSKIPNNKRYPSIAPYKGLLSFAKKQTQEKHRVLKIKSSRLLPRPLSEIDIRNILIQLNTWRDKAILFLALQAGMRIGEVLGLCFDDVNFRKKEITVKFRGSNPNQVRVKGMRERMIFVEEPEALQSLNNYILYERPNIDSQYIFLAAKGSTYGSPLTYQGIYTVFEYHCNKLGLKGNFTLHSLRHTHATRMYEKGMGILSLQKRLGHSSPQTTQIYAQVSDAQLKREYLNAISNNTNK